MNPFEVLVEKGDSLRMAYSFEESLDAYEAALDIISESSGSDADSLLHSLQDKILMSENGVNMSRFVDTPRVVAKQKFSIQDFYLYYPLCDRSWRLVPNQLDSVSDHALVRAAYVREGDKTLYWSSEDGEGIRNIYKSSLCDTLWSLPSLLNEHLTSSYDEIYPMLSPDGKSLFFSSAGLYGVGGYDLYVSRWNEESMDWDAPVNMGFPYSSPADDFLYIDSEDGRYSVFASNRDCSPDSVWVYALEFDNVPIRRSVLDPDVLKNISQLDPAEVSGASSNSSLGVAENREIQSYVTKVREVKALRDSVAYYSAVAAEVGDVSSLSCFREQLSTAQKQLQQIEVEFLLKGIILDPDKLMAETGVNDSYAGAFKFVEKNLGEPLNLSMAVPQVLFDYSFKVLEEAQFAEDQTIPSGLVYQIQIYASKYRATKKSLKGLSPVYEIAGANGNYVYRVGLFRTYSDVLSNLNTVKKVGFRNAFIVAFQDGKSLTVASARAKEKEKPKTQDFYEVRFVPSGGELDSSLMTGIRQTSGKDMAKSVKPDGSTVYVVGPFTDKAKADELVKFIKAMGINDVVSNVIIK